MLEILVSMALLVLVLVSFAVIYPSGFRLHRKSRMSTDAAQAARAVLNELKSLPLTDEDGGLSLAYLASNGFQTTDPLLADFPRSPLPQGYSLDQTEGVQVTLYDLAGGSDPSVYASIKVTLVYQDPYRQKEGPIKMTLVAGKSWNR